MGARKVAEPAAEGANVTVGSWQAPQEFEGIFFVQPNKTNQINESDWLDTRVRGFRNSSNNSTFPIHHSQFRFPPTSLPRDLTKISL